MSVTVGFRAASPGTHARLLVPPAPKAVSSPGPVAVAQAAVSPSRLLSPQRHSASSGTGENVASCGKGVPRHKAPLV